MTFEKGYALVVGVGSYRNIPTADIPISVTDASAVSALLQDPAFCGYHTERVRLLHDQRARRDSILRDFDVIANETTADDTVLFYYVGHGDYGTDGQYYLTAHDTEMAEGKIIKGTGISENELLRALRKIPAKRLLIVLNSCHSGEISPSLSFHETKPDFGTASLPPKAADALLSTGEGRIIITASRPDQKSWIGSGQLSIFTQAFVDGMRGGGYVMNHSGYISAFSLYEHLYLSVSETASKLGFRQEPELTVLKGVGPFPVALYRGASATGEFAAQSRLPEGMATRETSPEKSQRLFSQYVELIEGSFIAGDVHVSGGDFVGRDKIVQSREASRRDTYQETAGPARKNEPENSDSNLDKLFADIYRKVEARAEDPAVEREEIHDLVRRIQREVVKEAQASGTKVERWLRSLNELAPDVGDRLISRLISQEKGATSKIRRVAARVLSETDW